MNDHINGTRHGGEHNQVARWFFLLLATGVLFVYWKVMEPFFIVLVTAGIAAVILSPIEGYLRERLGSARLSSALIVFVLGVAILSPLLAGGAVLTQQVGDLLEVSREQGGTLFRDFGLEKLPIFDKLPRPWQERLVQLRPGEVMGIVVGWLSENFNVTSALSSGLGLIFKFFLFFICVFFCLLDRERIYKELLALSPFKDTVDRTIVTRMIDTVRGVVFGAIIVAMVQAVVGGIGMAIFGVPGWLIWASMLVVAAQVPIVGTSLIMGPVVAYLYLSGETGAALGMLIWAMVAVGLIDNLLSPLIVGTRTRMHTLLILLSILGGIEYFGAIGFILGPTILAAFLVVVELYKSGILEKNPSEMRISGGV